MEMTEIHSKIIRDIIKAKPESEGDLFAIVRKSTKGLEMAPPAKALLLEAYHKLAESGKIRTNKKIERLLTKRGVRTLSGVAVISVLTKPTSCPGDCLFCPTEKRMPKSYLSNEPAVMRAILNDFDPFRQVEMRLKALQANGHMTDKIELIVMGGTWSHHAPKYQSWFIKRCFEALNGAKSKTLQAAQKQNEKAKHRCIGLTLETRPDCITEAEIKCMRKLGCTRVELGIQHTDDDILKLNRRGHDSQKSVEAIRLLKEAGFKLNLHFMPNLYGSTPAKDLEMFKQVYSNGDYMPDMVKIYPCVVNEHADLNELYKKNKFKPYTQKQLINLIIKIKKITPPWVRITRLIRDIPEESIVAGNKTTNLRQLIAAKIEHGSWRCKCIRCREAGHQLPQKIGECKLKTVKYRASEGTEYFLSFKSPDGRVLYAFLRLRINDAPGKNFQPELRGSALVRELHTYGLAMEIGSKGKVQHTGLGRKLLAEAERIAKESKLEKIAVIAGIGVRGYYEKSGYKLEGTYMVKKLN